MAEHPGGGNVRIINPDEEVARLTRLRRSSTDALLVSETFQVGGGDEVILAHVKVTAQEFRPVPSDLGERLAAVVRDCWPAQEETHGDT